MLSQTRYRYLCIGLALSWQAVLAGPSGFTTVPIFNQEPLELRLGTFSDQAGPDALAVVLWNDGAANRLDAVRIPPPYDGSGITSSALENTANLFALGDICTQGSNVVVPYIKDFNIEVARYNGVAWSTMTVPGTTTNNFTTADCAVTDNGIFVSGRDFTDSEVELFRSTNGGAGYTFYGRYGGALGPFNGAVRDTLAVDASRYLASLHQTASGQIRVAHIDTAQSSPTPTITNVINLAAPSGSFTFVREAAARSGGNGTFYFTYNADGNARVAEIPRSNPTAITHRNLGVVNNTGSQFGFQGATLVHIEDENGNPMENNVLWGDYFFYDPNSAAAAASNPFYPAAGVGGPVDGCRVDHSEDFVQALFLVPRVGGNGTDLLKRDLPDAAPAIFTDGFESGDLSAWSQCD